MDRFHLGRTQFITASGYGKSWPFPSVVLKVYTDWDPLAIAGGWDPLAIKLRTLRIWVCWGARQCLAGVGKERLVS